MELSWQKETYPTGNTYHKLFMGNNYSGFYISSFQNEVESVMYSPFENEPDKRDNLEILKMIAEYEMNKYIEQKNSKYE